MSGKKRIKDVSPTARRIVDIGPKARRIDPDEVAKALGAEKCSEIPERFKAAAGAPLLARRRKSDS